MKKKRNGKRPRRVAADDILPEYDFSGAIPNKYAARYREATTVVVLDPDVAQLFPDSAAVNQVLRALGRIALRRPSRRPRKRRTA